MFDQLLKRFRKLHMIGIGGTGMSGIAEVLLTLGFRVSGSDMQENESTEHLRKLGATIIIGHSPDNVQDAEVVVYSSAVRENNLELAAARGRRIPVIRRAEMLAELLRVKAGVLISGAHGKTTTTSLIGDVVAAGNLDPTVIVGGRLKRIGSGVRSGKGDIMVAEADEYDQTFLRLTPTIAVITNVDHDHLECYHDSYSELESAFVQFANSTPFYGRVVLCLDEISLLPVLARVQRPVITYGFSPQADVRATNVEYGGMVSSFSVVIGDQLPLQVNLPLPGRHNVLNALAAFAVGNELGIAPQVIKGALEAFEGVHRRFEVIGEFNDILLVTDFGHHPTEIAATLAAARGGWQRQITALFQPHLFSRTKLLATQFGHCLLGADTAIVLPIYPAREDPIPGVTNRLIVEAAITAGHKRVFGFDDKTTAVKSLTRFVRPGDMVMVIGAGDIYRLVEDIKKELIQING